MGCLCLILSPLLQYRWLHVFTALRIISLYVFFLLLFFFCLLSTLQTKHSPSQLVGFVLASGTMQNVWLVQSGSTSTFAAEWIVTESKGRVLHSTVPATEEKEKKRTGKTEARKPGT
jgi:hypothetical protein